MLISVINTSKKISALYITQLRERGIVPNRSISNDCRAMMPSQRIEIVIIENRNAAFCDSFVRTVAIHSIIDKLREFAIFVESYVLLIYNTVDYGQDN